MLGGILVAGTLAATFAHADYQKFPGLPKQSKNVTTLKYVFNPKNDSYDMAWVLMADIFKNTTYDPEIVHREPPYMLVAETDLNQDGTKDYIAYPFEMAEYDEGAFCKIGTTICPFYIFTGTARQPILLGKIYANAIDVGKTVTNGYNTLKVFTREDDAVIAPEHANYFDTYKYDPQKKQYVNALAMPQKKQTPKPEIKK